MSRKTLFILPLALLMSASAGNADLLAEQRLSDTLRNAPDLRGDVVELQAEGAAVAAIFTAHQRGSLRGGVVLLHDRGENADHREVIRPLRLGLAEAGWETLSVQLPIAYRDESSSAWQARGTSIRARLQAALDWLRKRDLERLAIIAHGDSGTLALQQLAAKAPPELAALVLINATVRRDDAAGLDALRDFDLPLLDIYPERGSAQALDNAATRRAAAVSGGNTAYRQVDLSGARAGFRGTEDALLARVRGWLAASTKP